MDVVVAITRTVNSLHPFAFEDDIFVGLSPGRHVESIIVIETVDTHDTSKNRCESIDEEVLIIPPQKPFESNT